MRDNLSRRPRIDIPRTHWDHVADALAILGITASIYLLLVTWTSLPEILPPALLPSGEPVDSGDRWTVTLPLGMAIVNYVMLRALSRVPHYFNYPWPITEDNAAIQYRLSRSMIYWLSAVLVWTLLLIVWSQLEVYPGAGSGFPAAVIAGALLMLHLVIGVFIYRGYQYRHGEREDNRDQSLSSR